MHIAAAHEAIGRRRAIAASIGETQHGPRAIRPKTPANMHFIAGKGNAVSSPGALHRRKQFVTVKFRFNIEQAYPLRLARRALDAGRIADGLAEHLIAAAKAEHMAVAPEMREKIDIPALAPERREPGDRLFRAGQND